VVEHIRAHDLSKDLWGQIYRPGWGGLRMTWVVRTDSDPELLHRPIANLLALLDPSLPLIDPLPMSTYLEEATAPTRFSLMLMGAFGWLALVLVAIGIYGLVSHSVGSRLREFAIRLALGEAPRRLAGRVLGQGLGLVAIASALGIMGSLLAGRYLSEILFEVNPKDPATLAAAAAILAVVALAATFFPAHRASRVNPASLLRQD